MTYRSLGRSSIRVSPLYLGTMASGSRADEPTSESAMDTAVDGGIAFFDTANVYNKGESERIAGRWPAAYGEWEDLFLATKFGDPIDNQIHGEALSRRHLVSECEASLKRLQTNYTDLYQAHRMWTGTSIDETLRGRHDLMRAGKVLRVGASKWAPALPAETMALRDRYGWMRPMTEQPPHDLFDRRVEDELLGTCRRYEMGVNPWAPIAVGVLSERYGSSGKFSAGAQFGDYNHRCTAEAVAAVDRLRPLAEENGVSLAELSRAWVMRQPVVTAPIIGRRTVKQLRSSLKAVSIQLTEEDYARINDMFPRGSHRANYWEGNAYSMLRRHVGIEA